MMDNYYNSTPLADLSISKESYIYRTLQVILREMLKKLKKKRKIMVLREKSICDEMEG